MAKIPVWIDSDCGIDDAAALMVACKLDNIEILGVSAVNGNTSIDNAFNNVRNVLSLLSRADIKVYKGASKPLVTDYMEGDFHGKNGIGDVELQKSNAPIETENVSDAIYEAAKKCGQMTICTLGPLTNIATTIAKHPDFVDYVKEINMMGGSLIGGNVTSAAEFNVYYDAQAAENVFKSGIHVNMFGLDATTKTGLDEELITKLSSHNNVASDLFGKTIRCLVNSAKKENFKACLHDVCPILYLKYPEIFEGKDCGIYVETQGTITYGKSVADLWTDTKYEDRHCTAFIDMDVDKFMNVVDEMLGSY